MLQVTNKEAGFRDMFSVSPEAQQNIEQSARQTAIQNAISSLSSYQQEPEIGQIITQLQSMRTGVR